MWEWKFDFRNWFWPRVASYTYDGNDGRRVIDYMVYCGPLCFIQYRIAGTFKIRRA